MKVLFAVDLEGMNHVVGQAYGGLSANAEQYALACGQAALEINAAAEALFAAGVSEVAVWDNHCGGKNIDPQKLDKRINLLEVDRSNPRMYFGGDYDCICFFGYHAMEGTLGGVLAHTMNSTAVQFYKINGKYVGEVDIDAYIAASHGLPSCLFVGGDIACKQAERTVSGITTVTTKREISRNQAEFRDNEELFAEIGEAVTKAVKNPPALKPLEFPAEIQKSFKRMEDAAAYFSRLQDEGISSDYLPDEILGHDAHTVVSTVNNIAEFIRCI